MESQATTPQDLLDVGWRVRWQEDRHDLADGCFRQSLELARLREDKRAAGNALVALASNLRWYRDSHLDEFYLAEDVLYQAVRLFEEAGDEVGIAACLRGLGRHEESLAISRRIGDRRGTVLSLSQLANVAFLRNCPVETKHICNDVLGISPLRFGITFPTEQPASQATTLYNEAITLARQLGDVEVLAFALSSAGIHCGDDCQTVLLEAAKLYDSLGYRRRCAESLQICAMLACENDPALQEELLEQACKIWRALGRHASEAICLESLAELADSRGDRVRAQESRKLSHEAALLPEPY